MKWILVLLIALLTGSKQAVGSGGCSQLLLEAEVGEFVEIKPHEGYSAALAITSEQALSAIKQLKKERLLFEDDGEFLSYRTRRWSEKTSRRLTELTILVKLIVSDSPESTPIEVTLEIFGKGHSLHNELTEELMSFLPILPKEHRYTGKYYEYMAGGGVVLQKKKGEDFFTFASMDRETYRRGSYDANSIEDHNEAEIITLKSLRKN